MRFLKKCRSGLFLIVLTMGDFSWAMEEQNDFPQKKSSAVPQKQKNDSGNIIQIQSTLQKPNSKLSPQECERLKDVCLLFSTISIRGENGDRPLRSKLGWITPEALNDLKILPYLENKNWKDDNSLKQQMIAAVSSFYHLTENLIFMGIMEGTQTLSKSVTSIEDIMGAFSGLKMSFPSSLSKIEPFYPTIQKMMRNIVLYFKETVDPKLDPNIGVIPINPEKILGYIDGCFPFVFGATPYYEEIRLPYPRYPAQSLCLVSKGEIVTDSGVFLSHKGLQNFSLMKRAFMYYGAKSEAPFTISPLELFSFTLLQRENIREKQLTSLLNEEFPAIGETTFIPLPETQEDRDIIELLFLKDIQEKAKEGDREALKMIAYIEKEVDQPIEKIIEILTEDQLKIIEEQEKVSKAVAENKIQGNSKKKNKASQKKKATKPQKNSNKQEVEVEQKTQTESVDKIKIRQELMEKFINTKRVKYKKVLGVINRVMKYAVNNNLMEGKTGGSHKTLHTDNGAVTSVRPHGKKSMTIPESKVKRFSEKLLGIIDLK